jgi:multidrug resistance efflux pump
VDAAEHYLYYARWMLDKAEDAEDEAGTPAEQAEAEAAVEQWSLEVSRAEANLLSAESQLEAMLDAPDEAAVDAAEAQFKAAKEVVAEAQKQLDAATITAPFDGVVATVYVEEGDSILSPTTIIHLIDLTSMELEVEVDEIDIAEVKPRQRAIIEVDALPALQLDGAVTSFSLLP